MRQAVIKEVSELNECELELLLSNDDLRDDIMRYVSDIELLYVDDMLNYIKPYLYDYTIAAYDYSYMKVSDEVGFIHSVSKLNDDYGILNENMVNTLKLAIKAADDYTNSDMYSSDYFNALDYMSLYIKDLRDYLTGEFVAILEYFDTYEKVENESDYINHYLEVIYDSECLIDGNKVTLIQ